MTHPISHGRGIAYLDCFSGISGDMLLGALVDAGVPVETLTAALGQLDVDGYRLLAEPVSTPSAIHATRVRVMLEGHQHGRDWRAIRALIDGSGLATPVKARALAIFQVLAEAEAKVHGCPVAQVHFHEVGAVDSIVDIVGTAIGLDYLGIHELICSPLPLATGWVRSAHGTIPLPAPAVCELLQGVPVYGVDLSTGPSPLAGGQGMELVTPTGAAVVKACAQGFGPLPVMTISRVGYGAGSKERPDGLPNVLRFIVGQGRAVAEAQQVTIIETNLDDWSAESFPFLCERLFGHGALDVTLTPVQMKKGRPGFAIQVMALPAASFPLQQVLLTETSAIGLRLRQEERRTLPRALGSIATPIGPVRAKLIETPAGPRLTAEYEDCRRIALATGLPIIDIYRLVAAQSPELFCPDRLDEGTSPHAP